jgi:hypothetical protein
MKRPQNSNPTQRQIPSGHSECNAVHNHVGDLAKSALIAELAVAYAGQPAEEHFLSSVFPFGSVLQQKSPARLCVIRAPRRGSNRCASGPTQGRSDPVDIPSQPPRSKLVAEMPDVLAASLLN